MAKTAATPSLRLTLKEERFIDLYMLYGDAKKAYCEAYNCEGSQNKTIIRNAFELRHKPKVAARINELRDDLRKATDITRQAIGEGIARNITMAENMLKPSIAIKGYMDLARLYGLIDEKQEEKEKSPINQEKAREIAKRYLERQMLLVTESKRKTITKKDT